jgi:putative salt-induced outer membrane protein YdiY
MAEIRLVVLFLLISFLPTAVLAQSDVVVFINGDRLTGEVKSLERGLLRFKTRATDTIRIEWDEVAYVSSDQNIQVETQEGLRFLGALAWPAQAGIVSVDTISGSFDLDANRVVKMTPIKETLVGRFDGDVRLGYNFTKASSVEQLTLGVDLDYRTEIRIHSLDLDASSSDSGGTEASQRSNLNYTYRRLRANRWLVAGFAALTRNDELGLKLRSTVGAGLGRIIRQSNSMNLMLEGGLTLNREENSNAADNSKTWEMYGSLSWDWFRYDLPELDLSSDLRVYPSLSESGRVRSEFDITFKWEFIDDLFWSLSYYNSFDSNPADPDASKSDFGINTSVGWDF